MHEESLIRTLLQQVDEIALRHRALAVEEIELEYGPLSGIEPLLLESAFQRMCTGTRAANARFTLHETTLEYRCQNCQHESHLTQLTFVCQRCSSTSLRILRGEHLVLRNVQLQIQNSPELPESGDECRQVSGKP